MASSLHVDARHCILGKEVGNQVLSSIVISPEADAIFQLDLDSGNQIVCFHPIHRVIGDIWKVEKPWMLLFGIADLAFCEFICFLAILESTGATIMDQGQAIVVTSHY